MAVMDSIDILAFGAHPDDLEFGCGGILARAASEGKSIVMVDLTRGQKGTYGTPEKRQKEGDASSAVIKAIRVFLNFTDCEVFDTYEGRLELVKVIRKYKPKLVLAPYWKGEQTHPDHMACGVMARYACRYARFKNLLPELSIHWPEGILHYGNVMQPDFLIDVSSHIENWKKMMAAHESQHTANNYSDWVLKRAACLGVGIRVEYAQGLTKGNPVAIADIMTIAKTSREI